MKAEFRSEYADVRILRDKPGMFRLLTEIVFWSAELQREIRVPVSYETDFASIPKFLKDRIDVNGLHREACIIHDYGCTNRKDLGLSQRQVDALLREASEVLKVPKWERRAMYAGVTLFQRSKFLFSKDSYSKA